MLEAGFLSAAKRVLVPSGILAVNVITESDAALAQVEAKLGRVFSRGLRLSLSANTTFFLFNEECDNDTLLEVDQHSRKVRACSFQTQHAQTPALLERCQLTAWVSNSLTRKSNA
nr:RxLR effector candidate protein [Hyaloperonospora arabidopsidis Emoy2]